MERRQGDRPGMLRSEMRLEPHQDEWDRWSERERERIRAALGERALRVEHVGSTAVPDLVAKPIIDLAVVVRDARDFVPCVDPLVRLGYEHRGPHGDDPLRRYFVLDQAGLRVAQLHLWTEDARGWREAVAFRDLLRARPDLRDAYGREKLRAAERVGWDKGAYSLEKGPFIEALLRAEGVR